MTVIAAAHLLRGVALGWLPDGDVPIAVWAESEGAGDDVRAELASGRSAEIQAKKGLTRSASLWDALKALVSAVRDGHLDYGVLAVAPDSSRSVREDLPTDLARLAQGRSDYLTDIGNEAQRQLQAIGAGWNEACGRVIVRVVHALEADGADISAAKEMLRTVCADEARADAAWNALYRDAVARIEHRGRWTMPYLLRLLGKEGITIRDAAIPAAIAQKLADWICRTNNDFTLPAVRKPLPLAALIKMRTVATTIDQPDNEDAAAALARYHAAGGVLDRDTRVFDAEWTGFYKLHSVIVAGPGLGKSTLMTLLANRYATGKFPVLTVRLKPVAAAMEHGASFEQALRNQALDGSGVSPDQFDKASLSGLVLLADGLDDCGTAHDAVARALFAFAQGHAAARIIVTTRPIGYSTAAFADWQHYRLLPPDKEEGASNLAKLLHAIEASGQVKGTTSGATIKRAECALAQSRAAEAISTSPLLLGMAAAVIASQGKLPDTRPRLYADLIALFETTRGSMTLRPVPGLVAMRVLNALGWLLMRDPLESAERLMEQLASSFASALGRPLLAAAEVVEQAVTYWEQLGIIERVHHAGATYWTFVHKSFTEFTAARYLMALSEAERTSEIDRLVDEAEWHEVVAFAAGLGLGDEIARLFVSRCAAGRAGQMERALSLAAEPDAEISAEQVQQLAEIAFRAIEAGVPDRFGIGVALADLAKAYPDTIIPIAAARLKGSMVAAQLAAWACLASTASGKDDAAGLSGALAILLPAIGPSLRPSLLDGVRIADRKDRKLIEQIALAALEVQPDQNLKAFVETQLAHQIFDTWGFRTKVEALLRSRGATEELKTFRTRRDIRFSSAVMESPDEWRRAAMSALKALAEAAIIAGAAPLADTEPTQFPHFSALQILSGFGEVEASDVYTWERPFDASAVQAVVQALVQASAIDPHALSTEAAAIVRRIVSDARFDFFEFDLPSVDVSEPNWHRAAAHIQNPDILLTVLNHGSRWMAYLAGSILAACSASPDQSRALLRDATSSALYEATEVVRAQQPVEIANALILNRLEDPLPLGAEHLFDGLERGGVSSSPALVDAIRRGLASPKGRVAEAAARLAKSLAKRCQPLTPALLLEGYDRWRQIDGVQQDRIIPPSPRGILFDLLIAEDMLDEERLMAALFDEQPDVKKSATAHVLELSAKSARHRDIVVGRMLSRELPASFAANLLRREVPLSAAQISGLKILITDPTPKWRRVGVELLRSCYLTGEQIAEYVALLTIDDEPEIRDAVVSRAAAYRGDFQV